MKETHKYLNRDLICIRKFIHIQMTETSQSYGLNIFSHMKSGGDHPRIDIVVA